MAFQGFAKLRGKLSKQQGVPDPAKLAGKGKDMLKKALAKYGTAK